MLVERRAREGIFDGSVTVLVRRWRHPQATAGHVYRTAAGRIAVDEVTDVDELPDADQEAASDHLLSGAVLMDGALVGVIDVERLFERLERAA